jgi:hypothetical protein
MSLIKKRDVKDALPERPRRNLLMFQSKTTAGAEASPRNFRNKFSGELAPISGSESTGRANATEVSGSGKVVG